jgi:hypothetical protein
LVNTLEIKIEQKGREEGHIPSVLWSQDIYLFLPSDIGALGSLALKVWDIN